MERSGLCKARSNPILRGDSSDRIPGVFGIGQKTALALIEKFGSIENLYGHVGEIRRDFGEGVERKILESAEQAVLSKKLATIKNDAPITLDLQSCRFQRFNGNTKGLEYLQNLGFKPLVKRLTNSSKTEKSDGLDLQPQLL